MNGKIGPAADQNYEIWICTIFVIVYGYLVQTMYTYLYTKHPFLIINLHEQHEYKFVQFSY